MTSPFRAAVVLVLLLLASGIHLLRQATLKRRARELLRLSGIREQALEDTLGNKAELAVLTPRQKEVLQLIAEGHSTREIAARLHVSVKTVEAHRANMMKKMRVSNTAQLLKTAIQEGMLKVR